MPLPLQWALCVHAGYIFRAAHLMLSCIARGRVLAKIQKAMGPPWSDWFCFKLRRLLAQAAERLLTAAMAEVKQPHWRGALAAESAAVQHIRGQYQV